MLNQIELVFIDYEGDLSEELHLLLYGGSGLPTEMESSPQMGVGLGKFALMVLIIYYAGRV